VWAARESERVIQLSDARTAVRLWTENNEFGLTSQYYAIGLDGVFGEARLADYRVMLRYAEFDPQVRRPAVPRGLSAGRENEAWIVQFVTQPLEEYRARIEALGGRIFNYLPNYAYIVLMDGAACEKARRLPFVRWIGPYHPAYKTDAETLARLAASNGLGGQTRSYYVQVMQRGAEQKKVVAQYLRSIGGTVVEQDPEGFLLRILATDDQLRGILHLSEVLFVDPAGEPEADMDIAREIGGANYLETLLGYTGEGVRGEVMDLGLRTTHVAFQNPPTLMHNGNTGDWTHGTCTFGIVFGDGTGNPAGRGMLPGAEQPIFAINSYTSRYTHTAELVDPSGPYRAVFQSNSWGNPRTRSYTTISMQMDDIIFLNDIIICQSQSNAGNQDSRPEAWAKNVVSVGGVKHWNTLSKSDDAWGYGASTGPAEDGRIKPDLTHFYDNVLTTNYPSDTSYRTDFGGTSAATPIVAGHFGLLFQMWHEKVFKGFGGGASVFADRPHAMTAKALMIHSASQYPFPPATDMDRMKQGWGLPDLKQLLTLSKDMFIVNETDVLSNLQRTVYRADVAPGQAALRATMVYMDVAGTTSSSQHRINDLTLKLTSPSGVVYWGNGGLTSGVWSTPGGSADTKNTVENVFVQNPEAGVWQVEVWAAEVNKDSHTETPNIDADYALVVSGARRVLQIAKAQ
jgi:hypothetical protein